jgi:hypothetical protein
MSQNQSLPTKDHQKIENDSLVTALNEETWHNTCPHFEGFLEKRTNIMKGYFYSLDVFFVSIVYF